MVKFGLRLGENPSHFVSKLEPVSRGIKAQQALVDAKHRSCLPAGDAQPGHSRQMPHSLNFCLEIAPTFGAKPVGALVP